MITMIDRKRFLELVEKHLNRNCSKAEEAELEKYYHVYGQRLFDEIDQHKIRLQISQRIMAHAKKSKYSLDKKHKNFTSCGSFFINSIGPWHVISAIVAKKTS